MTMNDPEPEARLSPETIGEIEQISTMNVSAEAVAEVIVAFYRATKPLPQHMREAITGQYASRLIDPPQQWPLDDGEPIECE